ncbi:MAG: hypothetical protein HZB83_06965 [Deltaproteobacteria bacterium]|nr:hypothetical protein [Deltaproteobacteria bacterium]
MENIECVRKSVSTLLDSYEKSTAVITGLIEETACLVEGGTGNAQAEMISCLRRNLTMSAGMRKKDFDDTMEGVLVRIRERERVVREAIQSLRAQVCMMVKELREEISGKTTEHFNQKGREFVSRQRMREMEVARFLMELHIEKTEMNSALKKLISRGKGLKVKDFKAAMSIVKSRQDVKIREAETLLDEFKNARREILSQWRRVFSAYERGACRF